MKTRSSTLGAFVSLVATTSALGQLVNSGFSYQGSLTQAGVGPVSGSVDMRFRLWTGATGGTQTGPVLRFDGTAGNGQPIVASHGVFTTNLDFGAAPTASGALWLEVDVRTPHDPSNTGAYTTLSRQPLDATPFAGFSQNTRGLSVDSAGKVGIGGTNPAEKLEVRNGNIFVNGDGKGLIVDSSLKRVGFMKYANREAGIWMGSTQDFEFGRVNTADVTTGAPSAIDMYVGGNGNVGIGTTNLTQKLTVGGAIQSTSKGFIFPDGTVQTTSQSPFPGDSIGGFINGAAGVFVRNVTGQQTSFTGTNSSVFSEMPGTALVDDLPAGFAIMNWSITCWTQPAPTWVEIQPDIGGNLGAVVPFAFNVQIEHMTTSGSCLVYLANPIPGARVRLLWRRVNGGQVLVNSDDSVSWTLTVLRN